MQSDSLTPKERHRAIESIPSLWAATLNTENGFPIEFEQRKFLIDIYNDLSPLQVILKPPQIGATVMHTLKSFWVAKKLHKQIIYTLPTEADMSAMVGVTINRLVAQNPTLRQWVQDHDTVSQKSVGDSVINYRGTWSPKQAMMIPSDLNIHDEVDASNATVITQYETRLQAKADGWRWYFSHPSVAGFGVDIYWQLSDKKEWYVTCTACSSEQILSWPESIDRGQRAIICRNCGATFTDRERIRGEWRPTSTGQFSGYHISQLMCPWISAEKIIQDYEEKDEQYFYNYVLGLPYVGSENKITSQEVLKNITTEVNTQEDRIIIGVDTGLPIHFVCLNKQGVFYYGTCEDYEKLEQLLNTWKTAVIIADQGGDLIGIRQLKQKYLGRVFLVYYRKDRKSQELVEWKEGDEYGTIIADRNRTISLMVDQLRDVGRIRFNGSIEDWQDFAEHFDHIYRELVVTNAAPGRDDKGLYVPEYIWKRDSTHRDHFVHCLNYALIGLDRMGGDKATFVRRASMFRPPVGTTITNEVSARRILKRVYKDAEF